MAVEQDIVRAAHHMIAMHGEHAVVKAERRARNLWSEARDAAATWSKIARAIRSIQESEA